MSDFIWHWTDGDKKVFTRKFEVARKAMNEGYFVTALRGKNRVFKR